MVSWATFLAVMTLSSAEKALYITFHENWNNVIKFSMDGTLLGRVFSQASVDSNGIIQLRGMWVEGDTLLVCNADKSSVKHSKVFRYSPLCKIGGDNLTLAFNAGLDHPYGIVKVANNYYITNQDTNDVVEVDPSGRAKSVMSVPSPRGLCYLDGFFYVASSSKDYVAVFTKDFKLTMNIPIVHPTGVTCDTSRGTVIISSYDPDEPKVALWNVKGKEFTKNITTPSAQLGHPAGTLLLASSLLVLVQDRSALLEFAYPSGDFLRTVVSKFPDIPEQIILVDC